MLIPVDVLTPVVQTKPETTHALVNDAYLGVTVGNLRRRLWKAEESCCFCAYGHSKQHFKRAEMCRGAATRKKKN